MNIRKLATISVLVISSFAATNVAPTKAELESMYDKAFREFDANNFPEALKQLDAIDARQPDLAESQNLRGVIFMREGIYDKAEAALHEARYELALVEISKLRPVVDTFFDKVMVMVEDEAIRANRLALLASLLREFSTISDFSEIVTEGKS